MGWFARCPGFRARRQLATEVVIREAGRRFLSAPVPVRPYAEEDWEFAWLAAAAYGKTPAAEKRRVESADAEEQADPDETLRAAGWERWEGFPGAGLQGQIAATHLRVEVWEKRREGGRSTVAVTFGGTVFNNRMDWCANLRWFLPGGWRDEYTDVVRSFAPAFSAALIERLGGRAPVTVELISTGHSLGGD